MTSRGICYISPGKEQFVEFTKWIVVLY